MKKYVVVGTGSRGYNAYIKPLVEKYSDVAKVCGVYDMSSEEYTQEIKRISDHYICDFSELLDL